jgi:hypothetical protein
MTRKILITEDEKNNISNQHSEIDSKLMNFLLRRVEKKERNVGDDEHPINVIEISFRELPGYGFNNFINRKEMERNVIEMLYENDTIDNIFELEETNPKRVKIIKTIRAFLNFIMPKK